MSKPVILTGIRANNDLTIGNYFGAILPIIDMAKTQSDEFQVNMFIPDLHSFTTPIDHSLLYDQILHNARLFVAAGLPLDNDNIYLYRQSHVPAHSELTWILDCFTGMGEMSRMTQYKDKSGMLELDSESNTNVDSVLSLYETTRVLSAEDAQKLVQHITQRNKYRTENFAHKQSVSMGLYNYPVLMAADILLYDAKYVPVGEDQTQHLEFARDISERMNKRFGDIFTVPDAVKAQHAFFGNDQGLRIMDLVDPIKKMSKSDDSGRGVIFLGDEPAVAAKKVMGATTDDKAEIHYNKADQPGISNLLEILALLRGTTLDAITAEFEGQTSYGDFKKVVADAVEKFLIDFQQKLAQVDDTAVIAKLEQSEHDMNIMANVTLLRAQQAVGLRPKGN
jgi:tryptophanyl-tRNA synthetase